MTHNQNMPENSRHDNEQIVVLFLDRRTNVAKFLTEPARLQWQCDCGATVECGCVGTSSGPNFSRGMDVTGGRRIDCSNCKRKYFFNDPALGVFEIDT